MAGEATFASDRLQIRPPRAQDGRDVYASLREWGGLDLNSPYAYLLVCDRFASHCALGEVDDRLVGLVMGLCLSDAPDALFVWQVGVAPSARGRGVAARLIEHLLKRVDARFLEAHVGAQNAASEALFRGLARRHDADVAESIAYPSDWFPPGHDSERLLRIGPFREAWA